MSALLWGWVAGTRGAARSSSCPKARVLEVLWLLAPRRALTAALSLRRPQQEDGRERAEQISERVPEPAAG